MATHGELLVCGCCQDDVAVLRAALSASGPSLRVIDSPVQAVHRVMASAPMALVLGLDWKNISRLDIIPVIRAARSDLRVIVVAENDSLDLERAARQHGIFYYLVHPLELAEVRALLEVLHE